MARGKTTSKKMKRSTVYAERARAPEVRPASWLGWERLPAIVLLTYTICWCVIVFKFIAH